MGSRSRSCTQRSSFRSGSSLRPARVETTTLRGQSQPFDEREERPRVGRLVRATAELRPVDLLAERAGDLEDRKSTRLNSSHSQISYAVFCLKKKTKQSSTTLLLIQLLRATFGTATPPPASTIGVIDLQLPLPHMLSA